MVLLGVEGDGRDANSGGRKAAGLNMTSGTRYLKAPK